MKIAALTVAALATSASAATVTQNDTFSFPLSPGSDTITFDAFRSVAGWNANWQLQEVQLNFDITISGDVTAENNSALAAPGFGLTLNGSATVDFATLGGFAAINTVAASGPLGATDNGGTPNGSGPDFFDFGNVSDSFMGDDDTTSVAPYDVVGTIDAIINANAAFGFTGTTDATLDVANLMASGNVEIVYIYDVIPTPGAVSLAGLAGLAALRRRR